MDTRRLLFIIIGISSLVMLVTFTLTPKPETPVLIGDHLDRATRNMPYQSQTVNNTPIIFDDYLITPLAEFQIKARVLSRENYWLGREADLSPVDFALGWGRMANPDITDNITISQRNRWYYWKTDKYPIPRAEIENSSANMHMIPANEVIADKLKQVKEGDHVSITGKLVRIDAEDGWRWVSSLSRADTGDGACEVVYVTSIRTP